MTNWPVKRPLWLGIVTLLVLIGGFGGWAVTAQITGAVIANGLIEVDQNRQVVQHPFGGLVSNISVTEGSNVTAGQVLVRLDASDLRANLAIVEGQLFETLARRARLEAERDGSEALTFDPLLDEADAQVAASLKAGQINLFEARNESERSRVGQLRQRTAQIASQVEGIAAQQAALQTQIGLIGQELANQQSLLERGLAQSATVLNLQREEARLRGQTGELGAAAGQARERITEIEIQILSQTSTRREEAITQLRDLQAQEFELREKRSALVRQLDRLDIRAPVSGVVYGMTVFGTGAVIRPADPVLYIIPQDRPLVIAAQVATTDIDVITPGQEVALRFTALNQRTTPELYGTVALISADSFTDDRTRAAFYRAEIKLNDGEMARLPAGTTLIPGMPVDAFIRTADRTPANYLIRPLWDYIARTFRDG